MITTGKLNKHFNKNRKNQIHVINDIELSLPDKGFVVLLGPSGSGKTTLLNVLGGLDKVNGTINFNEQTISHYSMKQWDEVRNQHIGYIFQNYMLLEHISVFENIKLTLNMVGITDKEEIDKRISYLLEAVGLKNYKKRKAGMLSGGQQQRVAIARALAKNPSVIIADEPTGNLDSKNTIEIMNIIKKISETKLVLLVTHEKELAHSYADRVIELKDGQIISDDLVTSSDKYRVKQDTDIYLKDLEVQQLSDEHINVNYFTDQVDKQPLDIKLVLKNGTLYIDLGHESYKKVQVLDKNNEVKLIDAHYEDNQVAEVNDFNYEQLIDETKKKKNQPVISFKHSIKLAFNKILNQTRRKRLLFVGFLLSGLIFAFISATIYAALFTDEKQYMIAPANTVVVDSKTNINYDQISGDPYAVYIKPNGTQISFEYNVPYYYQKEMAWGDQFSQADVHFDLESSDKFITYGKKINAINEILIDESILEKIGSQSYTSIIGYGTKEKLLNRTISFNQKEFKIVGFTSGLYGAITMDELTYYQTIYPASSTKTLEALRVMAFTGQKAFSVYTNDVEKTIKYFNLNSDFEAYDLAKVQQKNYTESRANMFLTLSIFAFVIFAVTWISLLFVMRTSVIERMTELSVFRALGVRRIDIYKIYLIEVLVITLITSVLGYLMGSYYLTNINRDLINFGIMRVTFISGLLSLSIIVISNLVFGLLPIVMLLRKTPSQLMSSYDA